MREIWPCGNILDETKAWELDILYSSFYLLLGTYFPFRKRQALNYRAQAILFSVLYVLFQIPLSTPP